MLREEYYSQIINGQSVSVISQIEAQKDYSQMDSAYLALAYAFDKKPETARKILKSIDSAQEDSNLLKARIMETRLWVELHEEKSLGELQTMAQEILKLDQNSLFAKYILAMAQLYLGNTEGFLFICENLMTTYPKADWIRKSVVYYLFLFRKYKLSGHYLKPMQFSAFKLIYGAIGWLMRFGWILIPLFSGLRLVLSDPIWSVLFVFLILFDITLYIYVLIKKQKALYFPLTIILLVLFFLLRMEVGTYYSGPA